jgi:hypothetical protein
MSIACRLAAGAAAAAHAASHPRCVHAYPPDTPAGCLRRRALTANTVSEQKGGESATGEHVVEHAGW